MAPQSTNTGATGVNYQQALVWLQGALQLRCNVNKPSGFIGRKVAGRGWNGHAMWVYRVPRRELIVGATDETDMLVGVLAEGETITMQARYDMKYANGEFGIYTVTPEDQEAKDWRLLE